MTIRHILIFVLISLVSPSKTLTSITIQCKDQSISKFELIIKNGNDLLDIQSNANVQDIEGEGKNWLSLIPNKTAYLLQKDEQQWRGYRYFKNAVHYKTAKYNFSLYHSLIRDLLNSHSLQINLNFQDKYSLKIGFESSSQKWKIQQLRIQYIYHPIEDIPSNEHFICQKVTKEPNQSFAFRSLIGKGLHQQVNLTLDLDMKTSLSIDPLQCQATIDEVLPESTYIDVDQLRNVKRFEIINIQKPQHASKQYFYSYTIPFSKFISQGSRKYSILYPIHFRYPQPSHLNYTLVALHPADQIKVTCKNGTVLTIQQDPFHDKGYASIFNGSSQDTRIVSMVTFILTIIGSMIIMKQLRKIQ